MSVPESSDGRPIHPLLRGWSRAQAVIQLTALLGCVYARTAWPVAPCAIASFLGLLQLTRGSHTPSGRFGWANAVTLLRLALLLTLATRLGELRASALLVVCCVLGLDLLDGFLARSRGDASAFGAHFDMESDAQLVLVLSLRLWLSFGIGGWVLLAGLLRYLYVIGLWFWPGPEAAREAPRSRIARYSFALLMVGLCGALVLPAPLASASALFGTLTVTWSFARSSYFSKPAS